MNSFFSKSKTYRIRTMLLKSTLSNPFTSKGLNFFVSVGDDTE